jgi:arylformamidase
MRIVDISIPIHPGMVTWPGTPETGVTWVRRLEEGAHSTLSQLELCTHAGTHVDAPAHFVVGGGMMESLALDVLVGPAQVIAFPDAVDEITARELEAGGVPPGTRRLLCRTRNSALWARGHDAFDERFVGLTPDAAEWVVARGIELLGVDYLSVGKYGETNPRTHHTLLSAGTVLLEGLDLHRAGPGSYTLVCLPLKLVGTEGAPARAILMDR